MTKVITFFALLLCIIVTVYSCAKTSTDNSPVVLINCDSLVNDPITSADSVNIHLPNAFSPNGDGIHDNFGPDYTNIDSCVTTIFDENNNVVYYSQQLNYWMPKASFPQGEYYYRIQMFTNKGKRIGLCGFVYVLRCLPSTVYDILNFTATGQPTTDPNNTDPVLNNRCN